MGETQVSTMPNMNNTMMNGTNPAVGVVPTPNNQMPTGNDNWQL